MTPLTAAPLPPDLAATPMLSRWVRVAGDGTIEVRAGKVELGQGVWTVQLQVAADELDVPPATIRLRVGDTEACPDQGLTAGSQSTEAGSMALRRACAEVRAAFVQAAAARLGVDAAVVTVREGRFGAPGIEGGPTYGALSAEVDLDRPARGDVAPKPHDRRGVSGAPLHRPDLPAKLSGAAFLHDIEWPGMLHGRVVRPPGPTARLADFDAAARRAVLAMPGVRTLCVDGRYLAVAAEREEQAIAAAAAVRRAVRWDDGTPLPAGTDDQSWLRTLPAEDSLVEDRTADPDGPAADAVATIDADYSRPYLAHASIGLCCALARWDGGRLVVCSHTQGVYPLRRELAGYFGIDVAQVTVTHADGAGCYGHNGADDAAIDAAILARAAGCAVRLQWSREDELAWAPLGPAMSVRIAAGVDARGRIAHWRQDAWSFTHVQRPGLSAELRCLAATLREAPSPPAPVRDLPLPAGGGHRNAVPIYTMPSRRIAHHLVTAPVLRTSALRALGAFANVFAIESAMDELAALAGRDPLDFRLDHLEDPRARAVLAAAARACGWSAPRRPARRDGAVRGRGLGLARYKNASAYCAVVVEVEVTDRIVLDRAWVAVDAGEVVNPDGLVNQIEGGLLQAASWTLKEAVRWDARGVASRDWEAYPILGFSEAPRAVHVEILAHPELPPLGVGECVAGPTAGALANALADAIGVRARHLPLTPERLMEAVQRAAQ